MEIIVKGTPKEITELVLGIQGRQKKHNEKSDIFKAKTPNSFRIDIDRMNKNASSNRGYNGNGLTDPVISEAEKIGRETEETVKSYSKDRYDRFAESIILAQEAIKNAIKQATD